MRVPRLEISVRNATNSIDLLQSFKNDSEELEAKYQHFISEMIMLRLFAIFEDIVAEIAFKLAAGATYLNGSTPTLTTQANSIAGARGLFLSHGRPAAVQYLKWTKARYIRESVQHVIPATESYVRNAQAHGHLIEEMRKVRTVLAHRSTSARKGFRQVIRTVYGANVGITTGAFLTSTRRSRICNLNRYLASTKVVLNDLAKG